MRLVFPGSILVKLEWDMKCECVDGTEQTDDAQALRKGPCVFTVEYMATNNPHS